MKGMSPTFALLSIYSSVFFINSSASQTTSAETGGSGSICVLPNSPEPPTRISPGGYYNPNTLTVRFDKLDAIHWPHQKLTLIEGLDLKNKHLVVLTSDGKQLMSANFKFSDYRDDRLCAYFDGYQGIMFGNRSDALWCKVKKRSCWP